MVCLRFYGHLPPRSLPIQTPWLNICVAILVPIIAGIMPIISRGGMKRISELALGSRIPAKLQRAVSRAYDDDAVAKVGIHWATQQVFGLFDRGVTGIHFYTLNRSKPTLKIYDALGIKSENKPK